MSSFQPEILQCFLLSTILCYTTTDVELAGILAKLQASAFPQFAAHVSELGHVASSVHHEMYCFLMAFHNALAIFLQANSVLSNPVRDFLFSLFVVYIYQILFVDFFFFFFFHESHQPPSRC
jgi:hypothetical protein